MVRPTKFFGRRMAALVLCCLGLASQARAQTPQNPKPVNDDDVVRVRNDLVQTDVMVFDKQGRFVNGLKQSDFELRVDGKPQTVQFFERIMAGSTDEEVQLSAARGLSPPTKGGETAKPVPLDRGRTIFFVVDDLHLPPRDLPGIRKLLLSFIDKDMGQNDMAAIASVSGQIGFLQQLTDNRTVLHAAVDRLKVHPYGVTDFDRPPMTEYQALLIDRYDRDLTDYFVEAIMREFPGITRPQAETQVQGRAHQILTQAANITTNTLAGLEALVRSSSRLPGRKLVFFISSGFFMDDRNGDASDRLRRITSAAARSGVVIYSLDARGLVASLTDASSAVAFDPSGRVDRSTSGELVASQDALNALARDTGGRPVFNTNALDTGLATALKETSVYYLLAWRPEQPAQINGKFRRLSVSLPTRPDLQVRVRQGFFDAQPGSDPSAATKARETAKVVKPTEALLREALTAAYPNAGLSLALTLNYMNTPDNRMMLTASMQISLESVAFATAEGKTKAVLDLVGAVYNDQGKAGDSFTDKLTITAASAEQSHNTGQAFVYNYKVYVPPGLYQIRIGVRDPGSGKIGTVREWVEIPNLASHQLSMSSLIVGERTDQTGNGNPQTKADWEQQAPLRADRHFHRSSYLRFLVYVYNAARAADSHPDVALQIQILRDQQPVVTTPLKKISTEGVTQLDQIPYAADVSLAGLMAGRYVLHVTAIDRAAKTSTSQTMRFEIE